MSDAFLASVLARYRRYGWSAPVGEWGLIQSDYRRPMHAALEAGDATALQALLDTMFRGDMAYGLVTMTDNAASQLPHQVNWRLAIWAKITGKRDLACLRAPVVGSPPCVHAEALDGTLVPLMPDVLRFDCYAHRMAGLLPAGGVVFEIGGGYGGTALQLLRSAPPFRVVLCDIPETLYLAGYWLARGSGRRVAWYDDDLTADVVLLPAQDLARWTAPVDAVFSAHTLSGLDAATIAQYLAWLPASGARYFYHDDVTVTVTGAWMTGIFAETLASAITPPPCFRLLGCEHTPWLGLADRFCEFVYERGDDA